MDKDRLPLILLLSITLFISLIHYNYDWIPHDEGLIHGGAERIANGELPHINFYAGYTGFIFYYTNLLHRLFGDNLLSGRYPLILLNIGIIYLVFLISKHLFRDFAFLASVLCLTWGMNNYFAPLPSWYCLFFGLLSLYFLIIPYQEKVNSYYLFLSGMSAGFCFLFKQSSGIYNLLAILTYLCMDYLISNRVKSKITCILSSFCYFFLLLLSIFILDLSWKIEPALFSSLLALFPILFVALTVNKFKNIQSAIVSNMEFVYKFTLTVIAFISICIPFFAIFAINLNLFTALKKIFIMKSIYLKFIVIPVYSDISYVAIFLIIIVVLIILLKLLNKISTNKLILYLISFSTFYFISVAILYGEIILFKLLWDLFVLTPPFILIYSFMIVPKISIDAKNVKIFTALTLYAFFFFLTIIPYGYSLYYLYFMPFFIILLIYFLPLFYCEKKSILKKFVNISLAFFIIAGFYLNEKYRIKIDGAAHRPSKIKDYRLLNIPRGDIYVPEIQNIIYKSLYNIVNYHTEPGDFIFAYSGCSEVYYLTDRKNPCWHIYADITKDIESYQEILSKLKRKKVKMVILNYYSESCISSKARDDFLEKLVKLYPLKYQIGNFLIGLKKTHVD